ncbi:ATPase family associated with various cellular activities (AAA) domain-containing protein [Ditylenchus destructor]|nr:ATPase family associated with various cellular activities (AAA) domain-containing protein [Ditylenchus destructor]
MDSFFKQQSNIASSQKEETVKQEITVPWVEKYRPKNVNELVYQDEVVAVLKKCLEGADLPNLLFYGPPGTGKTSAAVALCRQIFRTTDAYKDRVLEMNASDERGIDVVRHRIKDFSRRAASQIKVGKSMIALKIVILDEADAMTNPAQAALRRTMESESQSTRFFLICNYITRIIEPLTSRCAKFRFKPLSVEAQKERLQLICQREDVTIDEDALNELLNISGGDLRKSITLLQSMSSSGVPIIKADVRETSGYVPDGEITRIMVAAHSGDIKRLMAAVKLFVRQGFSAYQVITQLADVILGNELVKPVHKAKIFGKMAVCEKRLLDGADEYLQLLDLFVTIQGCFFDMDQD